MNKYRFFTVVLVTTLAFGLTFTSCGDGSGNNTPKTITITGIRGDVIPWITGFPDTVEFSIFTSSPDGFVFLSRGWDDINSSNKFSYNDTITFPLFDDNGPWTGSGSFCLRIQFNDGKEGWISYWYTNGKKFDELGLPSNWSPADLAVALPRYKITSSTTTIPFSKFD